MLKPLLAGVALLVAITAAKQPETQPPAAFSLVLESTATGWSARCDSGCRWRSLSFDCDRACGAVLDANGVSTIMSPSRDSTTFRFRVERVAREVYATASAGTAWKRLTWGCARTPCRARLDPFGVSPMDRAR